MASTYSTNLKIELQATGENSGTWGTITNTNLGTALEQAIVGYGNPSYASDANLTLTYTDTNAAQAARALVLNVTSAVSLTATRELVVPTIQKQYIVQNNTTGSQSITVKTSAGTGITVPNGRKAHLYVDGTNVIYMDDYVDINGGAIDGTPIGASSASTGAFTTLSSSGNFTLSGGTANGVLYLNGSKVATSGTALVFDASNVRLGIGTASPAAPVHVSKSVVSGEVNFLTENTVSSQYGSANFAAKNDTGVTAFFGIQNSARITYGVMTASSAGAYTANAAGLYFLVDAAGSIRFATNGGTECARVASGGQFLIGTTSTVSEEVLSAAGSTAGWRIGSNRTAVLGSGNAAGGFNYSGGNASSATAGVIYARVEAEVSSATASSESGALVLLTRNSGTLAERARITSGGDIQIRTADSYLYSNATSGGTTIDCGFQFISSTKNLTFWSNNTERGRFDSSGSLLLATTTNPTTGTVARSVLSIKQLNDTSFTSGIQLEANADTSFFGIGYNGTSFQIGTTYRTTGGYKPIVFVPGGTTTLTLTTSATAQFANSISVGGATPTTSGAGVTFPATQSASSDANTLDDYEEGTWTPSLGGTATYTIQSGTYTKIGRQVTVSCRIQVNAIGTGTTTTFTGLPFTSANADYFGTAYWHTSATALVYLAGGISSTTVTLYGATAATGTLASQVVFQNSTIFVFTATYFV